jgi:Asp-tRNA(Asn)/Glu-tRNA(Gln) amidotransferase A subunit family amidase
MIGEVTETAAQIATEVRRGESTCRDVVERTLHRVEKLNPQLSAFCTVARDEALDAADALDDRIQAGFDAPLLGVPVSIKDLIYTSGIRTTGGSEAFATHVPDVSAIAVRRLERAGAIVIGKTCTSEFGLWGASTYSPLFDPTRNPWNPTKTTGGSSGGAGAAVAAGLGPIALGTDDGGSVRMPAHFCGVVGFKPTFGLIPRGPGEFPGFRPYTSHIGPLATCVADAALAVDVMKGPDPVDRQSYVTRAPSLRRAVDAAPPADLRIAYAPSFAGTQASDAVATCVDAAVRLLRTEYEHVVRVGNVVDENPLHYGDVSFLVRLRPALRQLVDGGAPLSAWTRQLFLRATTITAAEVGRALQSRHRLDSILAGFFADYDLLVTPTAGVQAFDLPRSASDWGPGEWMAYTPAFNLSGYPAISVPCGLSDDGLPVGMQIVGRPAEDATVLQLAAHAERLLKIR